MWRKGGKKRAGGDEISSIDSDSSRPAKRSTAASTSSDENDIVVFEISKSRRVSVRRWQGKLVVDIREFYEKDGKILPGKKGISLPMDQWKILREHIEDIDEAVNENS